MHTETGFTMLTAMGEITRAVIETVADRPGDSPARRLARQQTTASTMMSFLPRDPVETMLAGQCVIFDHLLRDGAHDTLRGQQQDIKLRARPQILAAGKMFLAHLDRLEQMRTRLADGFAVQPPAEQAASPAAGASTQSGAAASAPAEVTRPEVTRPPGNAEPVEGAFGAAKVGGPPHATVGVQGGMQVESKVGAPVAHSATFPAPSAVSPPRAHQDVPRQATTTATEPAVSQTVAAPATARSPHPAPATPSGGPGVSSKPAPHSELQRNQTPGVSGQGDAIAMPMASPGMLPSPGPGSKTSPERQPAAA